MKDHLLRPPKYPGRDRVLHRSDAGAVLWRKHLSEHTNADPLECTSPYVLQAIGLPGIADRNRSVVPVEMNNRCRKCANCLAHRQRLWTARAMDEIAAASRTWFGTLTIEPYAQFTFGLRAAARVALTRREEFSALTPTEQFKYRVDQIAPEITTYLKRVRKEAGVPLRYLLVSEAHKSGLPHFHILVHEPLGPIRKATLKDQWKLGFTRWKLVEQDQRAARYVCKYLSKDAETRVRASLRYGQGGQNALFTERAIRVASDTARLKERDGPPGPVPGGETQRKN